MDAMTDLGRERLWAHARLLMLTADFDGTIIAANPAWTTILGWPLDGIAGRSFYSLLHPDDQERTVARVAAMSLEGHQAAKFENRCRTADGGYRDIDWTAVPDGKLIHALGRDNTDEKRHAKALVSAEEAARQAQKMEAIGQLTGGVAHDFNNLLTVITGAAELLRRPNLSEQRRTRFVDAISDTAARAAKLTAQLLAFARRQALKPEVFDVGASIAEVATMIRTLTGSRIDLVLELPSEALFVLADRSQLDTAVVNLAINARDAMGSQGQLTISVAAVPGIPSRRSHPAVAGGFVAISVADTGCGIAEGDLSRVFEPFFTTKEVGHGTGLGLSQVIGFTRQSDGDVHVDSEVGAGTVFTLYLPQTSDDGLVTADCATEALAAGDGVCVLVVEDNGSVGDFAAIALRELGYDSVLVANAHQALAELGRNHARFQVVFSDVVMPGMSGLELAERIRQDYPGTPVVLTSGYSHVLAKDGSHGHDLLHKPYSIEQLSRVLKSAIAWQLARRPPLPMARADGPRHGT